jgi:hypothetical protein
VAGEGWRLTVTAEPSLPSTRLGQDHVLCHHAGPWWSQPEVAMHASERARVERASSSWSWVCEGGDSRVPGAVRVCRTRGGTESAACRSLWR